MTVRRGDDGTIALAGNCPVEDAEPLLQLLQANPTDSLDWRECEYLHTAVLQVVLAARRVPLGPCGDSWIQRWLLANGP